MNTAPINLDEAFCGRLPLHQTNLIQPHGVLIVVDRTNFNVIQVSSNTTDFLQTNLQEIIGKPLENFFTEQSVYDIKQKAKSDHLTISLPIPVTITTIDRSPTFLSFVHYRQTDILIEIEFKNKIEANARHTIEHYQNLQHLMAAINNATTINEVALVAASEIKRISGFDKVMIYSFDKDWNGTVLAEAKEAEMETYLGLVFPASDIPKQARELYLKNPYRIIPDRNYTPVELIPEINPLTNTFTNLSDCRLRSVVAVHLEYLKNMDVVASMSTRIIHKEQLWGLIACHHRTAKFLSYDECSLFEFISNVISSKISSIVLHSSTLKYDKLQSLFNNISEALQTHVDVEQVVNSYSNTLLEMYGADGLAICWNDSIHMHGTTPGKDELIALRKWLQSEGYSKTTSISNLPHKYEQAKDYTSIASGLLVLPIQPYEGNYVLAFRPEVIRLVNWGGNPHDPISFDATGQNYHPRNSFKIWKETVSGTATAWTNEEIEIAEKCRNAFVEHTLKRLTASLEKKVEERTNELAKSQKELQHTYNELRQFIYVTTHHLQEPVRKINVFSSQLKEMLKEHVALRSVDKLMFASERVKKLLRDLLQYSRLSQVQVKERVDLNTILNEVVKDLETLVKEKDAIIEADTLPVIEAVPEEMKQVFQSLISNSLKFSNKRPFVNITSERIEALHFDANTNNNGNFIRIAIKDNGIGFNKKYVQQLFDIFSRLHGKHEYEGTGIGLAITKKIIEKHNGIITANGEEDKGATFTFILPISQ